MGETPSIDVVVPTIDPRRASRFLSSLRSQTVMHRVWLVTNGLEPAVVEKISTDFPDVQVVALDENVGFGRAVNAGVAMGFGETVVLLNDDVEPDPGFLEEIVKPLSDPAVGMVAGLLIKPGSGLVDGFGIEADVSLLPFNRLRNRRPGDRAGVLLGPSGGAAAYRRAAWESVGGFDEAFFAYSEDLDLALRLREAGWTVAEAPAARGIHVGGASFGVDSPAQIENAGFGRGFILRRYGVLQSRHAARALLVEFLIVATGVLKRRSLLPIRARISGWKRASAAGRIRIPQGSLDARIGIGETIRRLRSDR